MRPKSVAVRLVLGAGLWIAAALVAGGLALSSLFRDSVERGFDARLVVLLESLVAASEVSADGGLILTRAIGEPRFEQVYSGWRSEEHTSELQSLMRISYAVFCLKKKHVDHNAFYTTDKL